jgi:hypothetical protein
VLLLEDDTQPLLSGAELAYDGALDRFQIAMLTGALTTTHLSIERSSKEVGVNVADPKATLHVVGSTSLASLLVAPADTVGGKDSQVILGENDAGTLGMKLLYRGANDRLDVRSLTAGGETPLLSIEGSGDVGIGTTAPTNPLHVSGTAQTLGKFESSSTTAARVELTNTGGGRSYDISSTGSSHSSGAGKFIVRDVTAGANRLTIDSTGKVGIGTSSPADRLHVAGNIRLNDNSDILGLDELVGVDGLTLRADTSGPADITIGEFGDVTIGDGFKLDSFGRAWLGPVPDAGCDFVSIQPPAICTWDILRVADENGASILSVLTDDFTDENVVTVTGDFSVVNGSKNFLLDHPSDPANKKLAHNAVEGPGYSTFYRGNAVLDAHGEAWVELPAYFDDLNTEPSYQLTCVGGFAPVYVASEARGGGFRIAGGNPGLKVSWQVTGQRDDPFAKDHPYEAEREKLPGERGLFYYPQGYGAPASQGLAVERSAARASQAGMATGSQR